MAGKGIPELLNYKQKGKDLNEFIKNTGQKHDHSYRTC